jgi:hypothetical protein
MTGEGGRIGEQNTSYRKGLVLGLTMAEAALLIIFVLLLLLAFTEFRRRALELAFQGQTPLSKSEVLQLRESQKQLASVGDALGVTESLPPDDFSRLVRVLVEQSKGGKGATALQEASKTLREMHQARDGIERRLQESGSDSAAEVARETERQEFRLANQDGQIKFLQRQLAAAGQGKGERPCWAQRSGVIDYLYDVVLVSNGIKMRVHENQNRARELALLPAPQVDPSEVLSEAQFYERTRPLFLYSLKQDCRFFVVVYDGTGPYEKALYKSHLRTVEGHFYKRLDDGRPPF